VDDLDGDIRDHLVQFQRQGHHLRRFQQRLQLPRADERLLQQAGILDGNGRLSGDRPCQLDLLRGEGARLAARLQQQRADHLPSHQQRHQHQGGHAALQQPRQHGRQQRLLPHVGHHQRLEGVPQMGQGRVAQGDDLGRRRVAARHGDHHRADVQFGVEEQGPRRRRAERLHALLQSHLEDVLDVQRLGQLGRDAVEQAQASGLLGQIQGATAGFGEEPGILQRDGRLVGKGQDQLLVGGCIEDRLGLLQGQQAADLALADQERAQPATHPAPLFRRKARVARHVQHIERLLAGSHLLHQGAIGNGQRLPEALLRAVAVAAHGRDTQRIALTHPQRHIIVGNHAAKLIKHQRDHLVRLKGGGQAAGDVGQGGKLLGAALQIGL